jgi:hypothetical protein
VHRVGQFVAHVRARVDPSEEALVERVLPPSAQMLFREMPVADRRHGLDVAHRLLASGHDDRDLLAAALLHDAGKGYRLRLWHRVSGVLLEAVAPGVLRRMASPDPRSWRHPFHIYLDHEAISAQMAVSAGCEPRTGSFIRGQPRETDAPLQAALKAADDAS